LGPPREKSIRPEKGKERQITARKEKGRNILGYNL
jgi:hypothetical protein